MPTSVIDPVPHHDHGALAPVGANGFDLIGGGLAGQNAVQGQLASNSSRHGLVVAGDGIEDAQSVGR
jgi:hypothetical protein